MAEYGLGGTGATLATRIHLDAFTRYITNTGPRPNILTWTLDTVNSRLVPGALAKLNPAANFPYGWGAVVDPDVPL